MKMSFLLLAAIAAATGAVRGENVCDESGSCRLPGSAGSASGGGVYSPVGQSSIRKIKQVPRLPTLNGKTIAVVGGSFMASVTHPEIRRLILARYPDAKVLVLKEVGSAGPWPGPGVIRRQKDDFVRRLKELKVDAVISGNGGCGLCTPREMGSCIAAEYSGLPSVMIAAPGFTDQAKRAAVIAGVPFPRVAEYPGAFSAHSREELLENTRKILWPQIVDALTKPFGAGEMKQAEKSVPADGIVYSGSLDEINHCFLQNGWTDGLPIIPPTPGRVAGNIVYV